MPFLISITEGYPLKSQYRFRVTRCNWPPKALLLCADQLCGLDCLKINFWSRLVLATFFVFFAAAAWARLITSNLHVFPVAEISECLMKIESRQRFLRQTATSMKTVDFRVILLQESFKQSMRQNTRVSPALNALNHLSSTRLTALTPFNMSEIIILKPVVFNMRGGTDSCNIMH
jgi:hypothetical protein